MTPVFRILANDTDITAKISDRLLDLRLHDEAGLGSDTAVIRLDNRDKAIAIPAKGAELRIYLGYKSSDLIDKGLFTVDETSLSGPPHILTIRAKAADMRTTLKATRSASYDDITIGTLVKTIAARHALTARVSDDYADVSLGHIDQTEESDLHLLTRLARQYGATAKPANGYLLFVPTGETKSATGKTLTSVAFDLSVQGGTYDYTAADRKDYAAVTARYRDKAGNKDVEITVEGSGDGPTYTLRTPYPTRDAAKAAAKAKLASLTRGKVTLSLSGVRGIPSAAAEAPLTVSGIHAEVDALSWSIRETEHSFSQGGFTTHIEAEVKA